MPQIEITRETEQPGGWQFDCQMLDDDGSLQHVSLTLSWADYNHWSPHGGDQPQHVAAAVLTFLLTKMPPAELRQSFDASRARAQFPEADAEIPRFIAH